VHFQQRYGWFFNVNFASVTLQAPSTYSCLPVGGNEKDKTLDSVSTAEPSTSDQFEKPENPCRDCPTSENNNHASILHSAGVTNENNEFVATGPRNNLVKSFDPAANISLHRKETDDRTNTQQSEDVVIATCDFNPIQCCDFNPIQCYLSSCNFIPLLSSAIYHTY
jgi:hypothetical protein